MLEAVLVLAGILRGDDAPIARAVALKQPRGVLAGGDEERQRPRCRHDPSEVEERRSHQTRPSLIAAKAAVSASAVIRSQRLRASSAIHAVPYRLAVLRPPELAPPGEVPGVRLAVIVARKRHRRALDHGRELVSVHVRVHAEAQRLALVVEPNLDAHAVDLGVSLGVVP